MKSTPEMRAPDQLPKANQMSCFLSEDNNNIVVKEESPYLM